MKHNSMQEQSIPLFSDYSAVAQERSEPGKRLGKESRNLKASCKFLNSHLFGVTFPQRPKHHLFHLFQMWCELADTQKQNTVRLRAFLCSGTNVYTMIKQGRSYARHNAFEVIHGHFNHDSIRVEHTTDVNGWSD